VKASLETKDPGLPESIRDLVRMVNTGGEKDLDRAVVANVRAGVERLRTVEPTLARYVETKRIKVIGAVYDLATGKVTLMA
jgi:carbonic anhydrase